jgi:hypothetical protein
VGKIDVHATICDKFRIAPEDPSPRAGRRGTRLLLAELFADLGYTRGAEVGVHVGKYAEALCQANPDLELLCVDPWDRCPGISRHRAPMLYDETKERLAPYNTTIVRKTSVEASKEVPDESLDFVYIDARHEFDFVMMDLFHWVPKVRSGGIVSGHDFHYVYYNGLVLAVETYIRAHRIDPWYVLHRDNLPSWLWVK